MSLELGTLFASQASVWNRDVLLRPMCPTDIDEFAQIALTPTIWRYFVDDGASYPALAQFVNTSVEHGRRGERLPFTVVQADTGAVAGSSAYGNLSVKDARIEIGWTWLGEAFQGTEINVSAKYLLLKYGFEVLGMERIEFKTDVLNERARAALKKIGAVEEGVLRSHTAMHDGRRRDTIFYSVLQNEWPSVGQRLRDRGATDQGWGYGAYSPGSVTVTRSANLP